MNRILKNAGYKPASVEAREVVGLKRRKVSEAMALAVARGARTVSALTETSQGAGARLAHQELEAAVKTYNAAGDCVRP